jgi:hypothetical protein
MAYDTTGFNSVPELQSFLGVKPDGVWGPISQKAYNKNLGRVAGVGKRVTQSAFMPQTVQAIDQNTVVPTRQSASAAYTSTTPEQRMEYRNSAGTGNDWTTQVASNQYTAAQLPSEGINPTGASAFANNYLGTDFGMSKGYDPKTNRIGYVENGQQMWSGDLTDTGVTPAQYTNMVGDTPTTSAFSMPSMNDMSSLIGGIAQLGSYFNARDTNKENKRMNDAKLSEFARLKDKDEAFSKNINTSGLGTRA